MFEKNKFRQNQVSSTEKGKSLPLAVYFLLPLGDFWPPLLRLLTLANANRIEMGWCGGTSLIQHKQN